MCIIIYKPLEKTIDKEELKACWKRNDDGAGYSYVSDGKIVIHKELRKFERFWKHYKETIVDTNLEKKKKIILHFRIKTSGNVDLKNIHPYRISNDVVLAHNGVITNIDVPLNSEYSDTYLLCKTILAKLPKEWYKNNSILSLLEAYIGSGSKLAILDNSENIYLVNEEKGTWEDGIWYSNSFHKVYKTSNTINSYMYDSWKCGRPDAGFHTPINYNKQLATIKDKEKELTQKIVGVKRESPKNYEKDNIKKVTKIINKYYFCVDCFTNIFTKAEIDQDQCFTCQKIAKDLFAMSEYKPSARMN